MTEAAVVVAKAKAKAKAEAEAEGKKKMKAMMIRGKAKVWVIPKVSALMTAMVTLMVGQNARTVCQSLVVGTRS